MLCDVFGPGSWGNSRGAFGLSPIVTGGECQIVPFCLKECRDLAAMGLLIFRIRRVVNKGLGGTGMRSHLFLEIGPGARGYLAL